VAVYIGEGGVWLGLTLMTRRWEPKAWLGDNEAEIDGGSVGGCGSA